MAAPSARLASRLAILAAFAPSSSRRSLARPGADEVRRASSRAARFSFGSFHQVALAWKHLDAFSNHIYRVDRQLLRLRAGRDRIVLVVGDPAGYGLAISKFPGRQLVLSLTLVVMIMPEAALVLPIFLELNALHLIGTFCRSSCRSRSSRSASTWPTSTSRPRCRGPAGRGADRRLRGVADVPAHRAAAGEAGRRARLLLQLRADWNNFFLPYVVLADRRSTRSRSGCRTCCRRRPRSTRPSAAAGSR